MRRTELRGPGLRHRVPVEFEPVVHHRDLIAHRLRQLAPVAGIHLSRPGTRYVDAVASRVTGQAPPSSDSSPLGVSARPTCMRGIVSGADVDSVVPPAVV